MTRPPIDFAVITELQDTVGAEFVEELAGTFLDEAPGMVEELRRAFAARDVDAFRRAAHSIKSNANVFGVQILGDLARELELDGLEACDEGVLVTVDETLAQAISALKEQIDV